MKMFLFDRNQKVKRWLVDRDFVEAKMVEQINAADQLTFSVPLNKRLPSSYFYAAIPQPRGSGYLLFKIVTEKVSSDQIEYTAVESAYDELKSYHYIKDVRPENRKAGELLQTALEGTRWQVGQTYDSGTFSTNFYYISTLEAIQKIVELCGLEVTFEITLNPKTHQIEHRLVNLYAQQGQRTGKRFEYGSNLLTVEREESAENLITALIGRGKGEAVYHEDNTAEETPDGYGRRINFADVVWSKKNGNPADKPAGQEYVEDVDATAKYGFDDGKPRIGIEIFEDITDPAELLQATWSALQTLKRPQASFRASVMDVGDLGLGDTVAIVRHDIKIEYFTRVYKVTHNLLDERQNTIELGDDFSGSSITSTVNDLGKSVGTVERIANYAAVSANGKNANYYGQAQPINPMEGDLWYKDLGNGETDMYQYHAGNWILITSTRDLHNVEKQVKQAQDDFTTAWNKAVAADSSAAKAQQRADDVGKQLQSAQSDFDSKLSAASASASVATDKAMQAANAAQDDVNEQVKELNAYKDTVGKTYVAKGTVISNVNTEANASIFSTSNKLYMDAATTVFSGKAFIPDAAIINLTASKLTAGTIDASEISVVNLDASNINTGTLNASLIKAGSMSADRIVGGTLNFKNVGVSNLSAGSIVSGTLDAAKVSVINLNASNIKTGTLDASLIKAGSMSADRVVGGTLDFSKVNAASLSADQITSGTLNAGKVNVINLNASNITSGTINGQNLKINLNTGEILFQKGKIASTNGLLNINVDDGTMSVTNSLNQGFYFQNGKLYLKDSMLSLSTYGGISWSTNIFNTGGWGIEVSGDAGASLTTTDFDGTLTGHGTMMSYVSKGAGMAVSNTGDATIVANHTVSLESGMKYDTGAFGMTLPPAVIVGSNGWGLNGQGASPGNNIVIQGHGVEIDTGNGQYYQFGIDSFASTSTVKAPSFTNTSQLSKKTNICRLDSDYALQKILEDEIYTYQFKADVKRGKQKYFASLIIDDVNETPQYHEPQEFLSEDKTGRDDGTQLAYLIVAFQKEHQRLMKLEEKINGITK